MIGAPPAGIIGAHCYCDLGRGDAERSECSPCTCGSCRSSQRGTPGSPRLASGAARPRRPRAPFLWIAKERGERKLAPGDVPRAFACDALHPTCADAHARASRESRAQAHAQKPSRPQAPARGKKTPHRPSHKKRTTPRTGNAWLKRSSRTRFTTTQHLCEVCRRKSHFYQFSRLAIAPLVGEVL